MRRALWVNLYSKSDITVNSSFLCVCFRCPIEYILNIFTSDILCFCYTNADILKSLMRLHLGIENKTPESCTPSLRTERRMNS